MKGTILLDNNENTKQVEEEEKTKFLKNLLDQIGVPTNEFWTDEITLSIEQRIKLRNVLKSYSIQVIDDSDGDLKVYVENKLIGHFHKSTYKLRRDFSQLDHRKQIYIEMNVESWTIFEET